MTTSGQYNLLIIITSEFTTISCSKMFYFKRIHVFQLEVSESLIYMDNLYHMSRVYQTPPTHCVGGKMKYIIDVIHNNVKADKTFKVYNAFRLKDMIQYKTS